MWGLADGQALTSVKAHAKQSANQDNLATISQGIMGRNSLSDNLTGREPGSQVAYF